MCSWIFNLNMFAPKSRLSSTWRGVPVFRKDDLWMPQDKLIDRVSGDETSKDVANGIFTTLPVVSLRTSAPVGFGLEKHERGKKEHIWNTRPS